MEDNIVKVRSKVILTLTSILLLDRIYAGQYFLGILKVITCGGCGLWAFYDSIILTINTLTCSTNGLYGITKWSSDEDINYAYWMQLIVIVLVIMLLIVSSFRKKNKKGKKYKRNKKKLQN